ncbi:unnamed protein product [Ambrosiozyma monospora]|uniref:Unnamed protein product n=1 Tax=Ambrosiozyma monospora TaxID=43982 RepID=A0ACB5U813_AMBMO|nr:unnamed protein product [Ambrosiozyma monospora]
MLLLVSLITDLVYIPPQDAALVTSANASALTVAAAALDPHLNLNRFLFELSWKDKEFVDFIPAFNQFDPLLPQNIKNFPMDVDMSDSAYLNFVWTLAYKTKFFYHLPLQSDETTSELLDNLFKLANLLHP